MNKFESLINNARNNISHVWDKIGYDVSHAYRSEPIQLTTKELKTVLLAHGEYCKITAAGVVWTCGIHKKALGAGVYSVWLSYTVIKRSFRAPMPENNHN